MLETVPPTTTEMSGIYSYHLKVSRKFTVLAGCGTLRSRALTVIFFFPIRSILSTDSFSLQRGASGLHNQYTSIFHSEPWVTRRISISDWRCTTSPSPMRPSSPPQAAPPNSQKCRRQYSFEQETFHNEVLNYLIPNITFQTQGPFGDICLGSFMQVNYSVAF